MRNLLHVAGNVSLFDAARGHLLLERLGRCWPKPAFAGNLQDLLVGHRRVSVSQFVDFVHHPARVRRRSSQRRKSISALTAKIKPSPASAMQSTWIAIGWRIHQSLHGTSTCRVPETTYSLFAATPPAG